MTFPMSHGIMGSNPTFPTLRSRWQHFLWPSRHSQANTQFKTERAVFSKPLINTDSGLHTRWHLSLHEEGKHPSVSRYIKCRKTVRRVVSLLHGKVIQWGRKMIEDSVRQMVQNRCTEIVWTSCSVYFGNFSQTGLKSISFDIYFKNRNNCSTYSK